MGMRAFLEQITPEQLSEFIANPRVAYDYISSWYDERRSHSERKQLPLEKGWHVLHYLLNQTASGGKGPLADVVLGGREIPDVDSYMSYGAARYLTVQQVSVVAEALAAVDYADLVRRFDPADAVAKQIYGIPRRPPEWMLKQLFENLPKEVIEAREARLEARLATLPPEAREQAREQARQSIENFLNPPLVRLSPEDVAELVGPARDFYADAAEHGNAMLMYKT